MRRNDTNHRYPSIRNKHNNQNSNTYDLSASETEENVLEINLAEIAHKIWIVIRPLLVALKYFLLQLWRKIPRLDAKTWFRVAIIALIAYLAFQRDLQIQLNTKSPFTSIQESPSEKRKVNQYAQPISNKENSKNSNPFAPASPEMLHDQACKRYIERFKEVAQTEQEKYGIPASIKMAQALIESRAGSSRLATSNNNHFGMKCFSRSCKKGHCSNFTDDSHKDFFRKYQSAWESWRAHSEMLNGKRYKHLQKYGTNYKKWSIGLKEAGYATDKKYDSKLIAMIQKYNLDKLDE